MQKTIINLPKKDIIGISVRTNNAKEFKAGTSEIPRLIERYRGENLGGSIPHSKAPGITYSVYTDYDSDEHGDYRYFIGEEVFNIEEIPPEFELISIPEGKYQKFTTKPGKMPDVVINAWQEIWKMSPKELGGERNYRADFEVYDKRAVDPEHSIVDIYIGIK